MHGAIDGAGRPCLIPAGALPLDSRTWLPLATVLDHIKAAGLLHRVHKLLILDCSRQPLNWHIGQLVTRVRRRAATNN